MPSVDAEQVFAAMRQRHELPSQAALARALGLDPSALSRWVKGRGGLSPSRASDLARRLGDDPSDYGIDEAAPLARGVVSQAPAWFVQFQQQQEAAWAEINNKLDALLLQPR